jgi:MoaA/NifB/PqqE/SkfB family radical SAM enzyme
MCALVNSLNTPAHELSREDYDEFISRVAGKRPGFVIYGGEPFIRKDTLQIMEKIKGEGLSCGVFTNGLLLDPSMLREIIRLKVDFVAFSVYGPQKIHDEIVGINGAYEKVMENAYFLKRHRKNTKVIFHCTISEKNVAFLKDVIRLGGACDHVRFGHLTFMTHDANVSALNQIQRLFPGNGISLQNRIFDPDQKQTDEFISHINTLLRSRNVPCTPELSAEEIRTWYSRAFETKRRCFFIWRGVFISPEGDVYPCMGNFQFPMGNILKTDFLAIWNSSQYQAFRRKIKKGVLEACARCCRL